MAPHAFRLIRLAVVTVAILVSCQSREPTIQVGDSQALAGGPEQRRPIEAYLAMHPHDPAHLLGAAMTSVVTADVREMLAALTCSTFLSRDGGRTWHGHEFPVTQCLDPWVTITLDGHAVFTAFAGPGSALVVFTSNDGGVKWAEASDTLGVSHDHPTRVADRSSADRASVYVVSSHTIDEGGDHRARVLQVARSTDSGETFEPPVHLRPSDLDHYAEVPVVLSDGTLVVSYVESTDSDGEYLPRRRAWVIRSTDGGRSFSDATLVNDACGPPYRLSWLAVDASDGPFRDRLYFACNLPGESGVVLNHSGENDASWSEPVLVHTAPADSAIRRKVMALAVNGDGHCLGRCSPRTGRSHVL